MLRKEVVEGYKQKAKALVAQMTLEEKVGQMVNNAAAIERLGIKSYNWWNEALHGVARAGVATVFPQAISMAATFDAELVHEIGTSFPPKAGRNSTLSRSRGITAPIRA